MKKTKGFDWRMNGEIYMINLIYVHLQRFFLIVDILLIQNNQALFVLYKILNTEILIAEQYERLRRFCHYSVDLRENYFHYEIKTVYSTFN
jgi:hypothetical protein